MLPRRKPCQEINTQVTLPDNSGYTWLFDSTDPRTMSGTALGKTAGVRTVGAERGKAKNTKIVVGASCAGHDCTLVGYTLDGTGAWQLYNSQTITAGAVPTLVTIYVPTPDFLLGFLAGATAPTGIATTFELTEQ